MTFIATMAASRTVSETHRLIGQKSPNFITSLLAFGAPVRGEAVKVKQRTAVTKNENNGAIRWWKNFDEMFSRFDTKHTCDTQTHRRKCRSIYPR